MIVKKSKDFVADEPIFKMLNKIFKGNDRFRPIGMYFGFIEKAHYIFMEHHLRKPGLYPGDMPFVMVLRFSPGISQNELSRILHVDKALTARSIKRLVKVGLVKKEIDKNDKRAYKLFLTKKAQKKGKEAHKLHKKWMMTLTKGITDNDLDKLTIILRKMSNNIIEAKNKYYKHSGVHK